MEWLAQKEIETIVDFEHNVEIVYEVSSNGAYVKKRGDNGEIMFTEDNERYGQKTYHITEERVETH